MGLRFRDVEVLVTRDGDSSEASVGHVFLETVVTTQKLPDWGDCAEMSLHPIDGDEVQGIHG